MRRTRRNRGRRWYIRELLRWYGEIKKKPPHERAEDECRCVEMVETVLNQVDHMEHAVSRRKVIDMVYFARTHTLEGAALQIPVCKGTVLKWNKDLMEAVSKTMNLI